MTSGSPQWRTRLHTAVYTYTLCDGCYFDLGHAYCNMTQKDVITCTMTYTRPQHDTNNMVYYYVLHDVYTRPQVRGLSCPDPQRSRCLYGFHTTPQASMKPI
jgi:hypothetical protein